MPPRKRGAPPTPAQIRSNRRNFMIFRLRGLWHNAGMLTGWRRKLARFAIDMELRRFDAEPEGVREKMKYAKWLRFEEE